MAYLMHFNPYHWGPGPKGGQFRSNPYGRYATPEIAQGPNRNGTAGVDTGKYTLTNAGNARYQAELKRNGLKAPNKRADPDSLNDPERWVREDLENAKSAAEGFRDATRYTKDLVSPFVKPGGKVRYDLSELSDAELRAILNREAMERQYSDYFAPKQVSAGEKFVKGMDMLGTVGSLGVTALGIALSIKQLRGGGGGK